jgi:hypothetical protein
MKAPVYQYRSIERYHQSNLIGWAIERRSKRWWGWTSWAFVDFISKFLGTDSVEDVVKRYKELDITGPKIKLL